MTIKLSRDIIAAAYDLVRTLPPFDKWNLPEPEDVKFAVSDHVWISAFCKVDRKGRKLVLRINVSDLCVGHVSTLIRKMAHECIHLHMALTGQDTKAQHNAAFYKIAKRVCRVNGFDEKDF